MAKRLLKHGLLLVFITMSVALVWLRWDAGRPREQAWSERQGRIASVSVERAMTPHGQLAEAVSLESSSGLRVAFRVIRDESPDVRLPVLVTLGGHRTGSDAVDLFGDVGRRAVVGIDYPYDGPDKVKGLGPVLATIPPARQAFLDTVPAVSLVLDWLEQQAWADTDRMILIGASLGAPFAATAARHDPRIAGLMLVHAAADNRLWLEVQVARRIDSRLLQVPLSYILHWLAYGPVLDTGEHVAHLAPRPLVIINARNDERTPADQAQKLFDAAQEPKRLRYTNGMHIQPNRGQVIAELLQVADEELPFLTGEDQQ